MAQAQQRLTREDCIIYGQFIAVQIQDLVTDSSGKCTYIESLDAVFEDLFGYRKFASKLKACRNDAQMLGLIVDFGLADLFSIVNSVEDYNIVHDLIRMDVTVNGLRKDFKRLTKKGKNRPKDKVKEYDYTVELYKDTVKTLRKHLGLSKKQTSYKRAYPSAKSFVHGYSEDGSYFGGDNYSRFMDDDDEDSDASTPFDAFIERKTHGRSKSKRTSRYAQDPSEAKTFRPAAEKDYIIDDDDDDEDDDPQIHHESYDHRDEYRTYRKLETIADAVQTLLQVSMTKPVVPDHLISNPLNLESNKSVTGDPANSVSGNPDIMQILERVNANEAAIFKSVDKLGRIVDAQSSKMEKLGSGLYDITSIVMNAIDDTDEEDEDAPDGMIMNDGMPYPKIGGVSQVPHATSPHAGDTVYDTDGEAHVLMDKAELVANLITQMNHLTSRGTGEPVASPDAVDQEAAQYIQTLADTGNSGIVHVQTPVADSNKVPTTVNPAAEIPEA